MNAPKPSGLAELAGDRRRAAASIVHFGQGDIDGVNAVLQEAAEADRVTPFILGLLDLYNDLVPAIHTPLGMELLGHHLIKLAGMEGGAPPRAPRRGWTQ